MHNSSKTYQELIDENALLKQQIQKIEKSEARYKMLFTGAAEGILVAESQTKQFIYANLALCRMFGYTEEELLQLSVENIHPKESLGHVLAQFDALARSEKTAAAHNIPCLRKDGSLFYANIIATSIILDGVKCNVDFFIDVTGHKGLEAALRESEIKYQTLFESANDAILLMDHDIFIDCNQKTLEIFGCIREQIIGQSPYQFSPAIQPDGRSSREKGIEKINAAIKGQSQFFEWKHCRCDGTFFDAEVSLNAFNDKGKDYIQTIVRDVTQRKKAEETLRQSEGKYRTILEGIHEGYFEVDLAGNFTFFNDSLCRFLGYSEEELMGMNNRQYTDKENAKKLYQAFTEVYKTGEPTEGFDWQIIRKDGTKRHVEASVSLQKDSSGKPLGFLGIVRDVTERKRAEDILRRQTDAMDSAIDGMAILNAEGEYIYLNKAHARMYGYENEGQLLGKSWRVLYDSDVIKRFEQEFMPELGRKGHWFGESVGKKKDGSKYPQAVSLTAMTNGGLICVVRDITEQKKAEEDLHVSEERFRLLSEASFEAIAIHEEGVLLNANDQYFKMYGYEPGEALGKEMISLTFAPEVLEFVKKQVATGSLGPYESIGLRKDGTRFPIEIRARKMEYKGRIVRFGAIRDITERKRAEEELSRLNRVLRMLSATNQALIQIANEATLLNEVCRIAVEVGDYRMAWIGFVEQDEAKTIRPVAHAGFDSGYIESVNITWADNERGRGPGGTAIRTEQPSIARNILLDPAFAPWRESAIARGYKSNIALPLISEGHAFGELAIYSIDADAFDDREVEILKELADDLAFGITALRTRAQRDQTEVELRESEERYRLIAENTADTIGVFDLNLNPTYISPSITKLRGYSVQESMTQTLDQMLTPDSLQKASKIFADQMALESNPTADPARTALMELEEYCKNGSTIWVELVASFLRDNNFKPIGVLTVTRDITERKQAEDALRRSENRLRAQYNGNPIPTYTWQKQGNEFILTDFNDSAKTFTINQKNSFLGRQASEIYKDRPEILQNIQRCFDEKGIIRTESRSEHFMPGKFVVITFVFVPSDLIMVYMEDITGRKKSEEALKNSEAKYRNIFENAVEGIYQSTIDGRIITANAAFARMAGYDSPEELIKSIKDMGTQLYVHPKDRKRLMEIRDAKGFVSGFEVEFYKKDGSKFWVVINARTVKDEQGKVIYLEGLIEDITVRKNAAEQLHQTLSRLKKAVGTTIQVLGTASEARDPYTAGHQKRVADLARTIATEMGLSTNTIEGIRMAGSIHDIGKLSIPAEILSKPTKLTDLEFSLIKEHSRIGYEMLKDVESPWPLAQIIYQHHERMNGTGYPGNLKGDEIIMEARIMAVADVVEAMASHRPYRPTLGIEAALEEIEKNKGILYDNVVADTCLRLFREKGYQLT
jgi:PAS domain S-box-containing protein